MRSSTSEKGIPLDNNNFMSHVRIKARPPVQEKRGRKKGDLDLEQKQQRNQQADRAFDQIKR